jgi:hypothetical protein
VSKQLPDDQDKVNGEATAGLPARRAGPARRVTGTSPPDTTLARQRRGSRLVDIARAVGVHTSTVSRVLNGDPAQSVRPEIYQ